MTISKNIIYFDISNNMQLKHIAPLVKNPLASGKKKISFWLKHTIDSLQLVNSITKLINCISRVFLWIVM